MFFYIFLCITRAIKKMSANEIRDFIFENYYEQIGFCKENSYHAMKLLKKKDLLLLANKLIEKYLILVMLKNTINHLSEKTHKISKTIRNNYLSTKTFENPNNVDIKSIITEHLKTSHKLSKTIKQAEKVGSNSSSYILMQKKKKVFKRKKCKNNKMSTYF